MATKLDANQVLQEAFDDATSRLKVDASVTANISAAQEVVISHADDSIKIGDGTNLVSGVTDSSLPVMTMNAMVPRKFDYVTVSYPTSVQEIYVFKTGGSGGTTVATITVNYTDATKEFVSNAART
jgi:hypothetical protein